MITQDQIKRVHDLVDKWGITDPIKQHCKMGEEIEEWLGTDPENETESEKEMGDVFFTLIALCYQKDVEFSKNYSRAYSWVHYEKNEDIDLYSLLREHLLMGAYLLKGKDINHRVDCLCHCLLSNCSENFINESEALEQVLIKNETKSGKTVNGTFIKAEDL